MNKIKVEKANFENLEELKQIEVEAFNMDRKYFKDCCFSEILENYLSEKTFTIYIKNPNYVIYKILYEDIIIGGMILHHRGDEQVFGESLFIKSQFQGKGIAKYILNNLETFFPDEKRYYATVPIEITKLWFFYVKICKFHIVDILNFDSRKKSALFLLEKKTEV